MAIASNLYFIPCWIETGMWVNSENFFVAFISSTILMAVPNYIGDCAALLYLFIIFPVHLHRNTLIPSSQALNLKDS